MVPEPRRSVLENENVVPERAEKALGVERGAPNGSGGEGASVKPRRELRAAAQAA